MPALICSSQDNKTGMCYSLYKLSPDPFAIPNEFVVGGDGLVVVPGAEAAGANRLLRRPRTTEKCISAGPPGLEAKEDQRRKCSWDLRLVVELPFGAVLHFRSCGLLGGLVSLVGSGVPILVPAKLPLLGLEGGPAVVRHCESLSPGLALLLLPGPVEMEAWEGTIRVVGGENM